MSHHHSPIKGSTNCIKLAAVFMSEGWIALTGMAILECSSAARTTRDVSMTFVFRINCCRFSLMMFLGTVRHHRSLWPLPWRICVLVAMAILSVIRMAVSTGRHVWISSTIIAVTVCWGSMGRCARRTLMTVWPICVRMERRVKTASMSTRVLVYRDTQENGEYTCT